MKLKDYLSGKGKAPKGKADWLAFCTLDIPTGALWAGDPHLANADDGHVTKVPGGRYVVEAMGHIVERQRTVAKLRVRLESEKNPTLGKELGDTGTDSAMIGVCDIKAFDKACGRDAGEEVQEAIEAQTEEGFGIIKLKKFPGAIMPFVPIGSDGGGPVRALISGRKRVGIELSFVDEESDGKGADQAKAVSHDGRLASLMGRDRDRFITRLLPDGKETSFWLGGELKANEQFSIWSSAQPTPVQYRIRPAGKPVPERWSPLNKKGSGPFSAFETLGPGKYEIDFRVGEEIYSALKLDLA